MQSENRSTSGFTLLEMMIGVIMFLVLAVALLQHLSISYSNTRQHRQKVFAFSKAQAILSELHSLVDSGQASQAVDLDAYDDGAVGNPVLSVATANGSLILPQHPQSSNKIRQRVVVRRWAGADGSRND